MAKEKVTLKDIKRTGAIMEGHFVGISGEHMPEYVVKDRILEHPRLVEKVAKSMASRARRSHPEVAVGPAIGGAILAQSVARELSRGRKNEVQAAYTEKVNDVQVLKRGYDEVVRGRRVVVIEDTVNTSKSIGETVLAVQNAGGHVTRAISVLNRNKTNKEIAEKIGVPYSSLVKVPMKSYPEVDAPAELMAVPVNTKFGHGAAYVAKQRKK